MWREPYVQTTVRITEKRAKWLEVAARKDPRLTPTFLVNMAIDQLRAKAEADRDPTPDEIAAMLDEKRKERDAAEAEMRKLAGLP